MNELEKIKKNLEENKNDIELLRDNTDGIIERALELIEYKCSKCNKLLFKGDFNGLIEIKCNKCKEINQYIIMNEDKLTFEHSTVEDCLKELERIRLLGAYNRTSELISECKDCLNDKDDLIYKEKDCNNLITECLLYINSIKNYVKIECQEYHK